MKNLLILSMLAFIGWSPANAQKKNSSEKVHVKIEEEVNGETIKIDSVFNSKKEADAYLKSQGVDIPEPPAPPRAPSARVPGPPSPPPAPGASRKMKKEVTVTGDGDGSKSYAYVYSTDDDDFDSLIDKKMVKVMRMGDMDMDFRMDGFDGAHGFNFHNRMKPDNSYRLEFSMPEPGTAKITVQGKDGKTLYDESLDGVEGNFHRDFDLEKYAGATLQLNVTSGKTKQTRKMVL